MDNDNWVKKCMTLEVYGRRDPGRPKKTWEQVIASDLCELGVTQCLAQQLHHVQTYQLWYYYYQHS